MQLDLSRQDLAFKKYAEELRNKKVCQPWSKNIRFPAAALIREATFRVYVR